jgi:AcrR family transcriptional regulator
VSAVNTAAANQGTGTTAGPRRRHPDGGVVGAPAGRVGSDQLLDAVLEVATSFGLSKLSMSDVAAHAGVSRPTLYKHFSSKGELVAAAVQREAAVVVGEVLRAAEPLDDPVDALQAAIESVLVQTRDHPLLQRILRTEPEALLPLLVTDGGGQDTTVVGGFVRAVTAQLVAEKSPELSASGRHRLADMIARLMISYAVNPSPEPPEEVASSVARILIHGAADAVPLERARSSESSESPPSESSETPSSEPPSASHVAGDPT